MKIFLIVLTLAILFVIGSAMMMQYFTGRSTSAKKDNNATDQTKKP
jgi:hypothetical protein